MKLSAWMADMDQAVSDGVIDESSPVIALHRNQDISLGEDGSFEPKPILFIERDEGDLDLMTYGDDSAPMTVADVRAWYAEHPETSEWELYVPQSMQPVDEDWYYRQDAPVIGPVQNQELSLFGVMVWYEGCESELS